MKKKKIIIITLVGIVLLGLLVWYLKKPSVGNDSSTIDTGEIKETTLKWEDIVDVDISGFEGDLIANISYKEIPELKEKIDVEEEKWNQVRDTLDPNNDASTIENYLNWLGEIRKPYNENFCELPADLNVKKKGDTIKITCGSETLKELNYKFNDGFEITLSDIVKQEDKSEYNEELIQSNSNKINENINEDDNNTDDNIEDNMIDVKADNIYSLSGDQLFIYVNDIDTVNLNQVRTEGLYITAIVRNESDFNKVKEHAIQRGNIDFIEYNNLIYDMETDFKEGEKWWGKIG